MKWEGKGRICNKIEKNVHEVVEYYHFYESKFIILAQMDTVQG